jgi:hypothetical protein
MKMFLFPKKEFIATSSAEEASFYKDILVRNGIDFTSKTKNSSAEGLMRSGDFMDRMGERIKDTYIYYIYVDEKDFDKAKNVVYEATKK